VSDNMQLCETDNMRTFFEQQVRAAVEMSGWTYAELAMESKVAASQIGRFMVGSRGLSSEGLGRILDCLGCTLSAPTKRREVKKIKQGRPKKPVLRTEFPPMVETSVTGTRGDEREDRKAGSVGTSAPREP
jgi:ribosome-binding protein aMBF1 (putative translation factor)